MKYSNDNKKIIIATGIYFPDIGGPATYSKLLASELQKSGKEVVVITYADDLDGQFSNEDFRVLRVLRGSGFLAKIKRYFEYYKAVKKEINKNCVVFAQDPISAGLPAVFAAKNKKASFILKIVGDYAWEQGSSRFGVKDSPDNFQNKRYGFFVEFLKVLERWVAKNAEAIVVPSEYLKKIVLMWGVKEERVKVILNSYIPNSIKDKFVENSFTVNADFKKEDIMVSVGRLVPWKGFDVLIKLMPELLKQNPRLILNIIGEGPERDNLEDLIKKLKLEKNVFLKGRLSKKDLQEELLNSSIFVLSTAYEGLSHQLLEVMDVGVPIITTSVGGNPEVIEDGKTGLLVELGDEEVLKRQILKLLRDKNLKKELAKNAKNSLTKFNKNTMLANIFKVLFS